MTSIAASPSSVHSIGHFFATTERFRRSTGTNPPACDTLVLQQQEDASPREPDRGVAVDDLPPGNTGSHRSDNSTTKGSNADLGGFCHPLMWLFRFLRISCAHGLLVVMAVGFMLAGVELTDCGADGCNGRMPATGLGVFATSVGVGTGGKGGSVAV